MDFWQNTLGAPVKIVAPMVDASELAWRLLSRKYGAQLCYTPMLHSGLFARDPKYRAEALASCPEDKPLIIQFCGNDPHIVLEAALKAQDFCSAIDINLGCPQAIAKRGHYGAYLQDEWPLLQQIVSLLSSNLKIPISCKIRRLETIQRTIDYAKMLENAGCKILTVHGRTREQKGPLTGLADWAYVKAVKNAVNIPVISNGNIQNMQDLERCLLETGANGVMTAEGNLYNPGIFLGLNLPCWEPALEYLQLVERYPCPNSYIRGHLFKLFHHVLSLTENNSLRVQLGAANTLPQFKKIANQIRNLYENYHEGKEIWPHEGLDLELPPWLCQPYVRAPIKTAEQANNKRQYSDADGNIISRKKMKKLRRILRRPEKSEDCRQRPLDKCSLCENPLFCGNDPQIVLEAALKAQDFCSAIDINLGCPQAIAKRGHYGAYLQDEWPLLQQIVSLLSSNLKIPISCKIRRLETIERTINYAKMLENAGCKILTVHGRTREQKGPLTGLADWAYVKAVKNAVNIPVISNGNIQNVQDLERCLLETGANGVMTAEGNLYNPGIFLGLNLPCWEPALEYLQLVERYPCPNSYIRGHLFKLFHHVLSLAENNNLRVQLGVANTLPQFKNIANQIRNLYENYHEGKEIWPHEGLDLELPPWLCQPYVRAPIKTAEQANNKRQYSDADGNIISRKRMKKLRRILRRPEKSEDCRQRPLDKCSLCENPLGSKCCYKLCKKCCRDKCFIENLDCEGHRILVRTRRDLAKSYAQKLIK